MAVLQKSKNDHRMIILDKLMFMYDHVMIISKYLFDRTNSGL